MHTTTITMDVQGAKTTATPELDPLSITDVAKGIVFYLALYLVQRAGATFNWLRGRPNTSCENW